MSRKINVDSDRTTEELQPPPPEVGTWGSTRYFLAYLAFFGFANVYALRVNLSVAILSMVNSTYQHNHGDHQNTSGPISCPQNVQPNVHSEDGEFKWDAAQQGLVLGSFFYGYIVTQLPGGFLAGKYGGKWLFGGGVLCTSILTLLTPVAARADYKLLIALRVLEGFGEGVTFPSMHAMWGRWAPPVERSFLISLTYAGSQFGTVIAQPISGVLCGSSLMGGWPSVFYVFGILGVIWCLVWFKFAHSSPEDHPTISAAELAYIKANVPRLDPSTKVPWKEIFTSKPMLALSVAHMCNNWGFYTLLTCLPTFLKDILQFDIAHSGFISAVPYLVMWISINLMGLLADTIRGRGILNTTQTRKAFNSFGLLGPALFLVSAGMVGCDQVVAVVLICLATCTNAAVYPGYNSNHVDLSSNFAGILMGISNTLGTIPGFLAPFVVGVLTENNDTRGQWQVIFMIAAIIYLFGTFVYLALGSGEEQSWNKVSKDAQPLLREDDDEHED